jgi:predicted nuclease with TOPRIM domain
MDTSKLEINLQSILVGLSTIGLLYIRGILSEFRELVKEKNEMRDDTTKNTTKIENLEQRVSKLEDK